MDTPLFHSPSHAEVATAIAARAARRFADQTDTALADLLADTVFHERKRLEHDKAEPDYVALLEGGARALRDARRSDVEASLLGLVRYYGAEIHNPFSPRAYKVATQVLPGAMARLLSASSGRRLMTGHFDLGSHFKVDGPLSQIKALIAAGATVVVAPTHVSNLDSPLIGMGLYQAGLPPCAYGAGLNLFSTPAMAFFMRRLGAYTVDRRKRGRLYKDSLKDYSTETIKRGCHSLFFPGGTRSRSGRVETQLKKGLLGTGILAWEERLREGKKEDVFVVPLTLSIGVVLEAETLVADALADEGKQRYIISDDEFSRPGEVASFGRRLMQLDCRVHMVFGEPMDVVGNPIDSAGYSLDPHGDRLDRRGYVTDRDGKVVSDDQRDQVYTERVSRRLCEAYQRGLVVQSTQLAAWAAWTALQAQHPGRDVYHLIRLHPEDRRIPKVEVVRRIGDALVRLHGQRRDCPSDPERVLQEALRLFAGFHKRKALEETPAGIQLSGELTWYYHNRLVGLMREGA